MKLTTCIYPNLYTTVQNAMPMLSGNTNLKLHMNFNLNEYYPTSTKYLGIFQGGRGQVLKRNSNQLKSVLPNCRYCCCSSAACLKNEKLILFPSSKFFSLSFWHVIHSACSMYMLKMKTILYGEKTTTCLYKATKMIMSNLNLIMIHCKNLNWF